MDLKQVAEILVLFIAVVMLILVFVFELFPMISRGIKRQIALAKLKELEEKKARIETEIAAIQEIDRMLEEYRMAERIVREKKETNK